jgi:P4 family phage/plasmid primase-like protien
MDNIDMLEKLTLFLKKYPKTGTGKHTHTIYSGEKKGSYTIPKDKIDELYRLLEKTIFEKKEIFSIVEKIQDKCPLIMDLDFKYKDKLKTRQYNDNVLQSIINLIFEKLDILYNIPSEQKVCWVMEKTNIMKCMKKGYESKDGIHLLFPYIISEKKSYRNLREILIEYDIKGFFEQEDFIPPSNSIEEIIDEAIYKGGNWFIYGSRKPNENERYELTQILKFSNNTFTNLPIDIYKDEPISIIRANSVCYNDNINVEYTDELNLKLKKKPLKNSSSVESLENLELNPIVMSNTKKHDIECAKKLALILSIDRASNYIDWLDVGYCLHSISPLLLNSWIGFSKKWEMYENSKECEKQWEWFHNNNNKKLTIGSLHYWARLDDPDKYKDIIREALSTFVMSSIKGEKKAGSHADVANVIYYYFKDRFACSDQKCNTWFYFNEGSGGKWEDTELGHILRKKLSSEIVDLYLYYMKKWQDELRLLDEDSEQYPILNNRVSGCGTVIIKLKDSGYKDKIMKECRENFYDKEFEELLDSNKNLIGFKNGIYDLDKSVFRLGLPSDYVSMTTDVSIPILRTEMPATIDEIIDSSKFMNNYEELNDGLNDFLQKVFPKPDVREYTLRFLSSCLSGEVREEKFYFWTGSGGNGKSKLNELMDNAMGDYSRQLEVSYLTVNRGCSSNASPDIELIRKARFVHLSEPGRKDVIYVSKLKQMTGGDKMTSRALFKDATTFKPQFKMVLMCNELPPLEGNDGGVWRRIEVVNYPARFVEHPRPCEANPYEYLMDTDIPNKLIQWQTLFMIQLLDKYRIYCKEGMKAPLEVKEATRMYRANNDIIANWFDDCVIEGDELFTFEELFSSWERWCDETGINPKQRPAKKEIKESLIKIQEKSSYGFVTGKTKSDGAPNGTKRTPIFNLKPIDD